MYSDKPLAVRNLLFDLVGRSCMIYAGASDWIFSRLANALLVSSVWVKIRVASIAMALLVLIDAERVKEEQEEIKDERDRSELGLMQAAVKLKDHALEIGTWTDNHTMALNDVGYALVEECGWTEERSHEYLSSIIETIPGLDWHLEQE